MCSVQGTYGRESDSGALRSPCCILDQDTFTSQKVLVIPRKRWLRPDMTDKIIDWDVKPQQNKQNLV